MRIIILFLFIICSQNIFSQEQLFVNNQKDEVVRIDPGIDKMQYIQGQVLLKLKEDVNVNLYKNSGIAFIGVQSIDRILQKHKVTNINKMFFNEKPLQNKRIYKTFTGQMLEQPSLHNIYKLETSEQINIFEIIDELNNDANVVYAEPNYILSIVEDKAISPALTESEMFEWIKENPDISFVNPSNQTVNDEINPNDRLFKPNVITPNDPLYSQQWGISATQIDAVWDSATGDTTQVIAILDTGVDWNHPDLKNKIWTNPDEVPDNGIDDDGNGLVDDIRGWDYINNDNNPTDDNSHGTHVAGIAGAESNNGIGIAGVNWKAKILPIKVFQSSGRGDAATITQGIIYAKNMGANVINMSFGSYNRSLLMEDALAVAYGNSVLVAAAGNDNYIIGPQADCNYRSGFPFFPAALSYVLGVQSDGGCNRGFSNYDEDGPAFSGYNELYNYELNAPGTSIISCIPNGNYRIYQGTSMAAPLVAGAISLYKKIKPNESQELMWGNIINTSNNYLQLLNAINIVSKPILYLTTYKIIDTLNNCDRDGRADAGETIELVVDIRNTWGYCDSSYVSLEFSEFEDTTTATILNNTSIITGISAYAINTNQFNPLVLKISNNVANNRDICFKLKLGVIGKPDFHEYNFTINVENGVELGGIISDTLILTTDKNYIVTQSLIINKKGVLIIKPGVVLKFSKNKGLTNLGKIIAIGTKDSIITFCAKDDEWAGLIFDTSSNTIFEFCNFTDIFAQSIMRINYTNFYAKNCSFINNHGSIVISDGMTSSFNGCNFYGNYWLYDGIVNVSIGNYQFFSSAKFEDCNIIRNINSNSVGSKGGLIFYFNNYYPLYPNVMTLWKSLNCFNNKFNNIRTELYVYGQFGIYETAPIYFGTQDSIKIQEYIYDFFDDPTLPVYNYSNYAKVPSSLAHGIVWKVLVNGKDAQDEYVEPLGVGKHRFDVYFNRPMDSTYIPNLSFGVREPYTQQTVIDSFYWSNDYKVFTAFKTIKLFTGDGINRIRVSGAKDLEGFEIPVEDQRFEFLISAASSASTEFMATAGLGKVNLEWRNPDKEDVPDLLGYNIYRMEHINDTTLTNPVMINSSLVADTLYTDYDVIPNKKYYYYYRVVRTNFSESDSSKVVSSIPYTASIGDGNGDLSVNVLDVLTTVSYILGQNPQPFIFDAADIVRDSLINVLDVVGNVNLILHGTSLPDYLAKNSSGSAKLELIGNDIYLTTENPVAGIQLLLKGKGLSNAKFKFNSFHNFENMSSTIGDSLLIVLLYNMNNNQLEAGKYYIGSVEGNFNALNLNNAVLSDNKGAEINLNIIDNGVSSIPSDFYLEQNYPNPFNLSTTIQYGIPNKTNGKIVIYNILGQKIKTFELGDIEPGKYKLVWDGKNNYGSVVASGVYIFRFESQKFTLAKKMMLIK